MFHRWIPASVRWRSLAIIVAAHILAGAAMHAGGIIATNTDWSADTVVVDSTVLVDTGATLTIAPGTVVMVEDEQTVTVRGRLLAVGAPNDSIVFTTMSTSIPWHGLRFAQVDPAADSSRLEYCRVEGAEPDFNGIIGYWGGGITIKDFSKISVVRSTIAGNGGNGMYQGGGVHCANASPVFEECLFQGNRVDGADARGAGMYLQASSPRLTKCVFDGNRSRGSMAVGAGIACYAGSEPVIVNCLFTGNVIDGAASSGGAVVCYGSDAVLINCTIALNGSSSSSSYGQALMVRTSSPLIVNTILWRNGTLPILINDTTSKPLFRNCLFEAAPKPIGTTTNRSGSYQDTVVGNPEFADTAAGDFSLSAGSPCVNSGTVDTSGLSLPDKDLAGNDRIAGGVRVDIGAFEYQGATGVPHAASGSVSVRRVRSVYRVVTGRPWNLVLGNSPLVDARGRRCRDLVAQR